MLPVLWLSVSTAAHLGELCSLRASLHCVLSTTSTSALVLCVMAFPLQAWQDNSNLSLESWSPGRSGGICLAS